MNDTQYVWNTLGRTKWTIEMVGLQNTNVTKPGLGHTLIEAVFTSNWANRFYGLVSPDKQHYVRVQEEPKQIAANRWKYVLRISTGDASEYISLDNFVLGSHWVLAAPTVAASKSDGTTFNKRTPGKWTNQFGFYRFGFEITGNIANKVMNIEFPTEDGNGKEGTTNLWAPWEMREFEIQKRVLLEEELWNSEYNRDTNGVIHLIDEQTNEPIPRGAGIKEILKTTDQYDTYSTLTLSKFDGILNSLFSNRTDNTPTEIVVYGGTGAFRMFNQAIKNDANANNYYFKLGEEEIMSGGEYLSYGRYFNQYKNVDGHVVTFKKAKIFDVGTYAQMDRANGRIYDNLPWESYNMVILDHSMTDDGERNIQLVAEKGREVITGVYRGLTNLPVEWEAVERMGLINLATRKDVASYEVMLSQGINMKSYTTSYFLEFAY